ncbi:cytochrome P450 2J6 [Elysia marginata]|uniref:Cytochrome P450 2J6 n=1 Tax=Elysia marginata TaxID=1093978 RepID=A0AAV4F5U2_9GAST|nr:cytochrome P450 2J6 [Elysia marginata]
MLGPVLVFLVTLVTLLWWRSRPRNAPPSPGWAMPVVGHLHLFKGNPIDQLSAWSRSLGNIFTIQMGPFRCVMLNGYDLISEACLKHHESLLERPNNFSHEEIFKYAGIISLGGRKWKEQRAFLQSTLRSLGMGRNVMAERIRVEADYLLATIEKSQGEATDISNLVMVCVTNVICGVSFSKRFDHEDDKIIQWLGFVKRLFELLGSSAVINFFPVLKYVPGDPLRYKELKSTLQKMRTTIVEWTEKEKRTVNISDEAFEDVVQAFLTEAERKKSQGVKDTSLDDANLLSSVLSFFNAGTETTANTIVFSVLYMVCFPDIQAKLYQEIEDVVGTDRAPDVSDKNKLNFLSAFIMETQRFSGVIPLAIDRLATSDIHLGGYTVTKGTSVMLNLDSMLRDEMAWGDPEVFRPDRFLDESGSVVIKKEFLPFGIGKRHCIGEGLATMELFIFISALVHKFEFFSEYEDKLPSMEPNVGFSRAAKPFKVKAIPRTT